MCGASRRASAVLIVKNDRHFGILKSEKLPQIGAFLQIDLVIWENDKTSCLLIKFSVSTDDINQGVDHIPYRDRCRLTPIP